MHTFAQKPKAAQPGSSSQKRPVFDRLKRNQSTGGGPRNFFPNFSQIPLHPRSPINIQAKLTVGPTGDVYEQEAERVSEHIMRMPEPQLQRTCACGGGCPSCQQTDKEPVRLQKKQTGTDELEQPAVPDIVEDVLTLPRQAARLFDSQFYGVAFRA